MDIRRRDLLHNATELSRIFDESGLDALVVRSGRNVAYLSGMSFPGTLGRLQDFADSPRAAMVVWPRDGEPTLVASTIAAGLARRRSWLDDIRPYTEYVESPYILCARILQEKGLGRRRIGVERREMGADRWESFRGTLPGAELVDCTDLLESVRNIKTPGEIALLKRSADIQDQAYLEVFESARPGDTEKELHTRMVAAMLRLGAESAHGMMQASTNPVTYGGEGPTPIDKGVALRTDYVGYFEGYASNLSRMAVMGTPTADQERMYRIVRDVHRRTIAEKLRPGVKASEVYRFVGQAFADAGFPTLAGLVGHCTGVWWHQEEPMLVPNEERALRHGMVICLEPILERFWHIQDEILITSSEPQLLSDGFNTDELFVMGA